MEGSWWPLTLERQETWNTITRWYSTWIHQSQDHLRPSSFQSSSLSGFRNKVQVLWIYLSSKLRDFIRNTDSVCLSACLSDCLSVLHVSRPQSTPPQYHVQDMKVPTALFSGGQDTLADPKDMAVLLTQVSPLIHRGHRWQQDDSQRDHSSIWWTPEKLQASDWFSSNEI